MATGSPVSFWYGTRAQFDSITTKLDTTLYFITDEQALYKGTVKFSGSGVDTLLTISSTTPSASSVTTGDKYFDTSDNLIHVLKNENGTVTTTATYEPANGALYYNADAQRFQTLIKNGSSYVPTEIYDAGISVEDGTGLVLNGTTVAGLDATTNSKGVVKVGSNLNVSNGVISVPVATNAVFGVVKSGSNITNNNGVLSVGKATTSALGVVKVGSNINVDNNGQISVPVANGSTKGVVSAGENVYNSNGVLSVNPASTSTKGVVQVGTNIDVDNGVLSVKDASTSNKGVVQLTNDLADIHSTTLAATPNLVAAVTDDLDSRKQDNMRATAPVDIENSNVSLNIGDGLTVGVTGTTNANKLIVNEASVKEVLEDVVDGGTEPAVNEIVTADNLRGALSVGQAVDVSSKPTYGNLAPSGTYDYLGTFTLGYTNATSGGNYYYGWKDATYGQFPKFAPGLKYLFIADVLIEGTELTTLDWRDTDAALVPAIGTVPNATTQKSSTAVWTRIACVDTTGYVRIRMRQNSGSAKTIQAQVKNWRQYEVTNLTNDAIEYLAQLPDPDAFFRSNTIDTVKNKYLVKNDMVCPWIKTISMPDNSDMTVAAGLSYKIKYTNDNPHTITADTIPTDAYGWDTHIQMFIKGTSAINFQKPLVLMDALTPNAGHNLLVKWRNGDALVYVDDTNAGYIVVKASGTENGSLYDGISNDYTDYVIFAAGLDGTTINAGDATFAGGIGLSAVNVLGNGTDKTTITGNISATSGNTINFQSLTIDGGTLGGAGTMNLDAVVLDGDVWVDAGSNLRVYGTTTIDGTLNVPGLILQNGAVLQGGTFISRGILGRQYGTFKDMLVTGSTWTATNTGHQGGGVWENCEITGNTNSGNNGVFFRTGYPVTLTNCYIHDNSFQSGHVGFFYDSLTVNGGTVGTLGMATNWLNINNYNRAVATVSGNVVGSIRTVYGMNTFNFRLHIVSGATLNGLYKTNTENLGAITVGEMVGDIWVEGGSFSYIRGDNAVATVSACRFNELNDTTYKLTNQTANIELVAMSMWSAENAIFGSPLDASDVDTVKLSGTTFTTTAKTLNANRIQLPASTTVSFQGNTNDADTKILDAGLIVVGDEPAFPSGTATVVNASGTSSTVTGIGTYIDKEGDNDFVANNATNVVPVDASTTGAKYLGTVLSATTGETGANRFAKIDSGAVAVVNEATNAVNKQIITHDYEPILGGTFSLTSATVDDATKTVAIQSGGTMSIMDIRGGKDSVIDLGGTNIFVRTNQIAALSGVNLTSGLASYGGALYCSGIAQCTIDGCVISGNRASSTVRNHGGGVIIGTNATAVIKDSVIVGNFTSDNKKSDLVTAGDTTLLGSNVVDYMMVAGSRTFISGYLKVDSVNYVSSANVGTVTLTSGAILDLTGNTNTTPIAPGGGVVINEPAYVTYDHDSTGASLGSSATAQICGGTFSTIQNGGVFNVGFNQLGPGLVSSATIKHTNVVIAQSALVLSDCMIDLGSARFVNSSTVTFGGTVKSNNRFGDAYGHEYIIKDNTTLNFSGAYVGSADFLVAGSTITIGSGAAIVLVNGTSVPLTSGTYTSAKINLDGTITEA